MAGILHWVAPGADAMPERCAAVIAGMSGESTQALAGDAPPTSGRGIARADLPPLAGRRWPARLKRLAAAMAGYDLLCTWGSGALDAVLAHTLFADVYGLAPLVHHEGEGGQGGALARRIAFGRTAAIVVPDAGTERLALERWQQPRSRVRRIADGIDLAPFVRVAKRDALPGLVKRRDELWLGVPPGSDSAPLIVALPRLPDEWQVVLWGDGLDRAALLATAEANEQDHRLLFAGTAAAERVLPLLDLLAATVTPTSGLLLQAMAARLPVVAPRGAAAEVLASANGPLLVEDKATVADRVVTVAGDPASRTMIGTANRKLVESEHALATTVERHRALYRGLLRR
ncbi:glycosyltransferase [Croceibacterium sp. TMG7-5b_MA50]|uniref:glycosyltransferase n=1 Tax=Croceibacterium sp. TMG7-5b_MA50 TaxID=3121290 RepID=UPI003221FF56